MYDSEGRKKSEYRQKCTRTVVKGQQHERKEKKCALDLASQTRSNALLLLSRRSRTFNLLRGLK